MENLEKMVVLVGWEVVVMEDWEVVVVVLVIWVGGMALDDKDLYSSGQQQQYPHSEIMFLKH